MDAIYTDHLKQTFRQMNSHDETIIREQINTLKEAIHKMKHNLQDLKNPDEADGKVKRTVKGITDFMENYAKIELNAIDSVTKAKHLTKCLEFVYNHLDGTDKNQKDMYDNLVAVILNLDGVARVFTAKEATDETHDRASSATRESGKEISMDSLMKGKAGKNSRSTDTINVQQRIEQLQKENGELLTYRHKEMENQKRLRDKIADLESENTELKKKLQQESGDKEDALNRLSKLAGNRMKIGNPDIADLSDPNRPLKLSDDFGELYCNEWTDALEYLHKKATKGKSKFAGYNTIHVPGRQLEVQEKGSIDILFEALKKCYAISKEDADHQRMAILNAVTGKSDNAEKDIKLTAGFGSKTVAARYGVSRSPVTPMKFPEWEKDVRTDDAHKKLDNAIKEFQRNLGTQTVKFMTKIISQKALSKIREGLKEISFENHDGDKLRIYVEKCAQLCWLMRIQFPPMHLKFDIQGDFDGKLCTPYLTSGEKVLFPVWPAMFLHEENGAIIRKGVVECTRKI